MLLALVVSALFVGCWGSEERLFELKWNQGGKPVVTIKKTASPRASFGVVGENVAQALFEPAINQTGWAFLDLVTNGKFEDEKQVYAAGFIEGVATHDLIYMHWYNTLGDFCQGRETLCRDIDKFVNTNWEWVSSSVKQHSATVSYWHQVGLFFAQIRGLADGYKYANTDPSKNLTYKDLLWLNLQGDFEDLQEVFRAQKNHFLQKDSVSDPTINKIFGNGHCSALIKVLPNGSDIFVAQDTWSSFQSMLRVLKKYDLRVRLTASSSASELIPGSAMSFSSYPGVIQSGDDFYLISTGLVTLETTIGNANSSLWKFVQPVGQISEGVRAMVANRLAKSGQEWSNMFSRYTSGTYNNQWMILDYTLFKPGTSLENLKPGLLWVLEQIPGYIHSEDMTSVLRRQSYWPSYNVAYFKDIFNMSGNVPLVEKYGDWFTYERTPRALIFRRDHGTVKDLKSMMALMRYNDFRNDPYSKCDCQPPYSAENAIAARCDLNPANGTYPIAALGHRSHGATDAKITSHVLFTKGLQFLSVSGPVYNITNDIPPFQWSKTDFQDTPHLGHPDLWTFQPLIHKWAN